MLKYVPVDVANARLYSYSVASKSFRKGRVVTGRVVKEWSVIAVDDKYYLVLASGLQEIENLKDAQLCALRAAEYQLEDIARLYGYDVNRRALADARAERHLGNIRKATAAIRRAWESLN